jgi:hypothetical protein
VSELINIGFPTAKGKEICEIIVKPSSEPIVLTDNAVEEFYVREGNSTNPYRLTQALEYSIKHFQNYNHRNK